MNYTVRRVGHKYVEVECTGHKPKSFNRAELEHALQHADAFENSLYMEALQAAYKLFDHERKPMKLISKEAAAALTLALLLICLLLLLNKPW